MKILKISQIYTDINNFEGNEIIYIYIYACIPISYLLYYAGQYFQNKIDINQLMLVEFSEYSIYEQHVLD